MFGTKVVRSFMSFLKHIPLLIALAIFFIYGFVWTTKPRKIESTQDVLKVFYYDFLRLKAEHVEVVKLTDKMLITISRNPCPILRVAQTLKMDTRYVCRLVSETVCRYVLRRMNPNIMFERDYSYIRPYRDGCLEKIYIIRR